MQAIVLYFLAQTPVCSQSQPESFKEREKLESSRLFRGFSAIQIISLDSKVGLPTGLGTEKAGKLVFIYKLLNASYATK